MKRWLLVGIFCLSAVGAIAVTTHARQAAPPPQPQQPQPQQRGDDRGPMGGGPDGFGGPGGREGGRDGRDGGRDGHDGGRDGGHDGGFGGPGGPGGGPGEDGHGPGGHRTPPTMDVMRNYVELVSRYTELSRDPTTAGVSAAVAASDLLRAKGNEAAVAYFEKLIPEIKDETVNRAVRAQLVELYKAANQTDKALEQLRILMTAPAQTTLHTDGASTQP